MRHVPCILLKLQMFFQRGHELFQALSRFRVQITISEGRLVLIGCGGYVTAVVLDGRGRSKDTRRELVHVFGGSSFYIPFRTREISCLMRRRARLIVCVWIHLGTHTTMHGIA